MKSLSILFVLQIYWCFGCLHGSGFGELFTCLILLDQVILEREYMLFVISSKVLVLISSFGFI